MKDRIAGAPGQYSAVVTGGEYQKLQSGQPFAITLTRDDQPEVEGTPYSKAAVLPDDVAQRLCPGKEDPTPADAFDALSTLIWVATDPNNDGNVVIHSGAVADGGTTGGVPGLQGPKGEDGVSATHSWNGTVLTITSASGTSSADLKGEKGDNGDTPVKGIDYWTEADKAEMVADVISALPVYNGEVI